MPATRGQMRLFQASRQPRPILRVIAPKYRREKTLEPANVSLTSTTLRCPRRFTSQGQSPRFSPFNTSGLHCAKPVFEAYTVSIERPSSLIRHRNALSQPTASGISEILDCNCSLKSPTSRVWRLIAILVWRASTEPRVRVPARGLRCRIPDVILLSDVDVIGFAF